MQAREITLPTRKYQAWIEVNDKIINCGKFDTEKEANKVIDDMRVTFNVTDSGVAKTI